MNLKIDRKGLLLLTISLILVTDAVLIMRIPVLSQALGFIFLIILPGGLGLFALKINQIRKSEWIVLSIGLSAAILMLSGAVLNYILPFLGYQQPLSELILISYLSVICLLLASAGYLRNRDFFSHIRIPHPTPQEKALLTLAAVLPVVSILGMRVFHTTENNTILLLFLLLVSASVVVLCLHRPDSRSRLYPVIIVSMSFSVLLIYLLRFPHLFGRDIQSEYYLFRNTLESLHWVISGNNLLDACLSISLLPTIVYSVMQVPLQDFLYRLFFVVVCSFTPLVIYNIASNYFEKQYALLGSFFFLSQSAYLDVPISPRTSIGIFFASLAVMVLFSSAIDHRKRKFLFVIYIAGLIISHYSSTYILFIVFSMTWLAAALSGSFIRFRKVVTLAPLLVFGTGIFLWYSQITDFTFREGILFIDNIVIRFNNLYLADVRSTELVKLTGQGLKYPFLGGTELALTWGTFLLIALGIFAVGYQYWSTINTSGTDKYPWWLTDRKIPFEYYLLGFFCCATLGLTVVLPYASLHYGVERLYSLMVVILTVFFIVGGRACIVITQRVAETVRIRIQGDAPAVAAKKRHSDIDYRRRSYLLLLIVVVPYFLFTTGVADQLFGPADAITLNAAGARHYNEEYVDDQEVCSAQWLRQCATDGATINTFTTYSKSVLVSQGGFAPLDIDYTAIRDRRVSSGYAYLDSYNVVQGETIAYGSVVSVAEYGDVLRPMDRIYENGVSTIYMV